jgi:hypothetical protein
MLINIKQTVMSNMLIRLAHKFQKDENIITWNYYGPVWFSFFLTSFSENLAVGRIWLWGESEYHYDYVWRKIKLL